MILAGAHLETFTRRFKERCDDLEIPRRQREMILEEVREGLLAPGRENLLPLNYEKLGLLFDYLDRFTWLLLDPRRFPRQLTSSATQFVAGPSGRSEAGSLLFRLRSFISPTGTWKISWQRARVSIWSLYRFTSSKMSLRFTGCRSPGTLICGRTMPNMTAASLPWCNVFKTG